jgi:TonB family protein
MRNVSYRKILYYTIVVSCMTTQLVMAQENLPQTSRLSVSAENKSLRDVLIEIAKQSNIRFVFNDALVDGKTITCRIDQLPKEEAIQQIMNQVNISYRIMPIELIVLYNEDTGDPILGEGTIPITERPKPFIPIEFTIPSLTQNYVPDYPAEAMMDGLEGSVEMNLLVGEDGTVGKAVVVRSSGFSILDNAAIQFAKKLKYNPAQKQGRPIEVWVSRVMHYQLVDRSFVPKEYMKTITALIGSVDETQGKERDRVLKTILDRYEGLAKYLDKYPNLNYNEYLQRIIRNDILEEWKVLWKNWPLHYLLFQDFVLRYPDQEDLNRRAINRLTYYMKKDIENARKRPGMDERQEVLRDLFLQKSQQFLEKALPGTMTEHDGNHTEQLVMQDG